MINWMKVKFVVLEYDNIFDGSLIFMKYDYEKGDSILLMDYSLNVYIIFSYVLLY